MQPKKNLKNCKQGHQFHKSSDCPTSSFLSFIPAPARRALENNGIKTLEQLSVYSQKEILQFHGMGKSTIPKLQKLLSDKNLSFNQQKT